MSYMASSLRALAPIICATLLGSTAAFGQAASDVQCTKCVDAGDIAKGAIDKKRLAKGAVIRSKIAKGAVNAARLADGAVTEAKIRDGAVTGAKIRGGAVTAGKIAPLAVTGDKIAPQGVTAPKLAPGAATSDKIADGAVTGLKLEDDAVGPAALAAGAVMTDAIADGAVETSDLANGSVGGLDIAAGAVTAAALAGSITGPRFAAASVTADKIIPGLGGLKLARTIVVGPTGTPTQNGTALKQALANITDNAADSRYVVKLEPGVYDIGADILRMKPFVDIEGSGAGTTFIRGGAGGPLVRTGSDVELRALAVEHDHDATFSTIAIEVTGTNVGLSHVTAHAENDLGGAFGIQLSASTLVRVVLSHVTASAFSDPSFAYAIYINIATADFDQVRLVAVKGTATTTTGDEIGLLNGAVGTGPIVRDSVFTGTPAIENSAGGAGRALNLFSTQLVGGTSGTGTFRCVGAYDGNFAALDSNCDVPTP